MVVDLQSLYALPSDRHQREVHTLNRLIYSLLFYTLIPFVILRLLWRSRREPLYRQTFGQRFGFCEPVRQNDLVWLHSVSAGETNAAAPLVSRLLDLGRPVLITTMTPTGRQRVRSLFGDRVIHYYAPYDLPGAVVRFLGNIGPATLILVDTELWPNMIHYANRSGVRTVVINARMSEKSARGYARVPRLTRAMMNEIDVVAVQSAIHGERFCALGLPPGKLVVAGSIKFDVTLPADLEDRSRKLRARLGQRQVIVAASTHAGEEDIILDAFSALADSTVLLVLAPRHPHRADEVHAQCQRAGFEVARHSTGAAVTPSTRVLLLDTMGELMYFYAVASIAIVAGSFQPVGGHNPLEPIALNVPVIMGPYLRNIEDIAAQFRLAQGMLVVQGKEALHAAITTLLSDASARQQLIKNAVTVMQANRGALERVLEVIGSGR